jgi:hypothetical protein
LNGDPFSGYTPVDDGALFGEALIVDCLLSD